MLSGELLQWMDASARFTAFVETYRDKIRKKVRVNRDLESLLDLRSELEVAARLLSDRRLEAAYEPYASAKIRGPDFAITYRANLVFNIEVARIRVEPRDAEGLDLARKEERIVRILLDKLGQMQPGMANLLFINTHEAVARAVHLEQLMQALKNRVEAKDPTFYAATRYSSPAAFYKDFLRLSGILVWASAPDVQPHTWANKQARPGLAENVIRLVALTLQ
jgi:hypothetical protein